MCPSSNLNRDRLRASTVVRGIIWDIDGTLLDSNDAHAAAFEEAFRSLKIEIPFTKIRQLIGMGSDHLIKELTGVDAESALGKKISALKKDIFFNKYFEGLRPFPAAKELITKLSGQGFVLAVATSASRDELDKFLDFLQLKSFMTVQVTASDVEHSKPDPDLVATAIRKMGFPAREIIMVGDTPYDISAAAKAGIECIGFTSGGWSRGDLRDAKFIYEGPRDLLNHLPESIFSAEHSGTKTSKLTS